jgi:hypothetical protein
MPDSAPWSPDQSHGDELGETTSRLVDAHKPGDGLPSLSHHNCRAAGNLVQVGTEVVLELANSHLDLRLCSYMHGCSVATLARGATRPSGHARRRHRPGIFGQGDEVIGWDVRTLGADVGTAHAVEVMSSV